jgi:hypothetical protein
MTKNNFAENLIKGKIAETIFAQMLRETKEFTVLEFGYEKIIPELVQQGYRENSPMVETLRTAPDFAVINQKTKEVKLIEVKYRSILISKDILGIAERMAQSWNPSYLFIASSSGFYFDEINKIIKNKGGIEKLNHPQISEKLQEKFLGLLNRFLK